MSAVSFTVIGVCYSMKNSRILARGRTIEHPKCRRFREDFAVQVPFIARINLGSKTSPLRTHVSVWYPTEKQDLDVAVVYDLLQACGVVANDRFIIEKHEYRHIDRKNPRVEIQVEEI
jgi:Holliday junction resolvase RusA-like endonuclease